MIEINLLVATREVELPSGSMKLFRDGASAFLCWVPAGGLGIRHHRHVPIYSLRRRLLGEIEVRTEA